MLPKRYLSLFRKRPLRYLVDNKIIRAPKNIEYADVTPEFISSVKEHFRLAETDMLKSYYLILKTDYDCWATYDQGLATAFVAASIFVTGAILGTAPQNVTVWTILVATIVTFYFIAKNLRTLARKKAKAVLFMNIIEDLLRDGQDKIHDS